MVQIVALSCFGIYFRQKKEADMAASLSINGLRRFLFYAGIEFTAGIALGHYF